MPLKPNKSYCEELNQEDLETCIMISKILNISKEVIARNIYLFQNINPHAKNALYYFSQIEVPEMFLLASHYLKYVLEHTNTNQHDKK